MLLQDVTNNHNKKSDAVMSFTTAPWQNIVNYGSLDMIIIIVVEQLIVPSANPALKLNNLIILMTAFLLHCVVTCIMLQ